MTDELKRLSAVALQFPDPALRQLYERAKRDQWQIEADLDARALDLSMLPPRVRRAMAQIYRQIHYGETLGLLHLARAVGRMESPWGRQLGAIQISDEARHVEFFGRALDSLDTEVAVSPSLIAFFEELESCEHSEDALLGIQIVLEVAAQAVFVEGGLLANRVLGRAVVLPGHEAARQFLTAIVHYVGRDEARHVALGVLYARHGWNPLSAGQRTKLTARALRWCGLMHAMIDDIADPLRQLGIDSDTLTARVKSAHAKQLRAVGLEAG